MKPATASLSAAALACSISLASAASYPDATGDFTGGSGFLDMTSATVNNDASVLTFTINLASDPSVSGNDWATHLIGFDTAAAGSGNISGPGGWGKDIQMSSGGMNFFIGNWLNNGGGNPAGATLYSWDGAAWNAVTSTGGANPFNITAAVDTTAVTISLEYAALGLSPGDSFNFDIYSSTSGGDNVLDALGSNAPLSWNSAPYDSGSGVLPYTIAAIPEPGALSLLSAGALLFLRRRLN
ncbi:MAG TPA: PEP-CTERM sorting domain-containing protein [Verrucomicrobiae bacterium]|nr:PEP-CTERM sorting domain-containing protein [Verrucomicrobiae bacterium]